MEGAGGGEDRDERGDRSGKGLPGAPAHTMGTHTCPLEVGRVAIPTSTSETALRSVPCPRSRVRLKLGWDWGAIQVSLLLALVPTSFSLGKSLPTGS